MFTCPRRPFTRQPAGAPACLSPTRPRPTRVVVPAAVLAALALATLPVGADADTAVPPVGLDLGVTDEVHVSWGPDGTSAVVHWRGSPVELHYGPTLGYGRTAVGRAPAIAPVDHPGPFREAALNGLSPGTTYHYRIGTGPDRVFRTSARRGSVVRWVDIGDTASTACKPWMASQHALIAELAPQFVTHGGDISYANACGVAAVHRLYSDVEVWAANATSSAAFMPVWGNHEYGPPTPTAPPGTPRDSLANYKGRHAIPHPQTLPADGPQRVTAPGCPSITGRNACRGEDWGWFRAGNVLLISYPEPWGTTSLTSWQRSAAALMASAHADPDVHAIVTFGHRPPVSSTVDHTDGAVTAAIAALASSYSPKARADGKYLLNLSHHVHGDEVFPDFHGVAAVVNGGGGVEQIRAAAPVAGSAYWSSHPALALLEYRPSARTLRLTVICGATIPANRRDPCIRGTTMYHLELTPGTPLG